MEELKYITKISSVGLHALDDGNNPISSASGCIIRYKGRRFLISVSHAVLTEGKWGLELGYDFEHKGIKYFLPQFEWLKQGSINTKLIQSDFDCPIEDLIENPSIIDFAYAELPDWVEAVDEYFDFEKMIRYFCPKNILETNLAQKPIIGEKYSFYGNIRTVVNKEVKALILTPRMQMDIDYVSEFKDDYYRFRLPDIIKDKYDYKGCSGAPILNNEGKLISLVTNGAENTNLLLGIRFEKLKIALDIKVGDFT